MYTNACLKKLCNGIRYQFGKREMSGRSNDAENTE